MQLLDRTALERDVLAVVYRLDRTQQSPTGRTIIDRLGEERPDTISESAVYETLNTLVRAGYLEETPLGRCKRYALTGVGRQAIVGHLHALNQLCR